MNSTVIETKKNFSINLTSSEMNIKLTQLFSNTIEEYDLLKDIEEVIFLFSGGKDATIGLLFLQNYLKDSNIKISPIMVTYPTHVYYEDDMMPTDNFSAVKKFWKDLGVNLNIFDSSVPDLTKNSVKGCKICKNARKEIVDEYLNSKANKETIAIVTGYTLYDVLAYVDEYMLITNFSFDITSTDPVKAKRINNCLHKIKIKEKLESGYTIIRPLLPFHETDIKTFLLENSIPYINKPCKVASAKHKRLYFKALETINKDNKTTYKSVVDFLKSNNVEFPETFDDIDHDQSFTDC